MQSEFTVLFCFFLDLLEEFESSQFFILFHFIIFIKVKGPYIHVFFNLTCLTLSPLDGPYGPNTNTVINTFSGGKLQNIVKFLMALFYNSLRFHLTYLAMFPPEKRRILWVLPVD